jgi:hypothetical protein
VNIHVSWASSVIAMERSIDSVDTPRDGDGLPHVTVGRAARLVQEDGVTVATGETTIDDEDVFGLIDKGRR